MLTGKSSSDGQQMLLTLSEEIQTKMAGKKKRVKWPVLAVTVFSLRSGVGYRLHGYS